MNVKLPTETISSAADINAITADLAALRADFARLAGHIKDRAADAAGTTAGQVSAETSRLVGAASDAGKSSVKAIERQIDEHPLAALMLAFSLGFIGSRMLAK